ncbi:MAG TPA: NAD(P)-dependent oxidoreductase [Acidimicrobiales bacterium]|jgi:3-hydroxyisobutyrate dehydrogenase|nr:NAD(P)-dependent oxidoreductase [Acidimicrobiales bacterium]
MTIEQVGFVGLGNMGRVLAANLVGSGFRVLTHDVVGSEHNPPGATFVSTVEEVARAADVIVCSLPDGAASEQVAALIAHADECRTESVVDTSTIGVAAARSIDGILSAAGIGYVDAPVSGGVAGARARTLSVMYAGPAPVCDAVEPVLAGLSDRRRRVGEVAGLAQVLKLANNFLSAVALAATSEAVSFGVSMGLDIGVLLEVLDASSGQSQATSDKFPNHILSGSYSAGFANTLMAKDLRLYLEAAAARPDASTTIGAVTASLWDRFVEAEPGADFTRIYPFLAEA